MNSTHLHDMYMHVVLSGHPSELLAGVVGDDHLSPQNNLRIAPIFIRLLVRVEESLELRPHDPASDQH